MQWIVLDYYFVWYDDNEWSIFSKTDLILSVDFLYPASIQNYSSIDSFTNSEDLIMLKFTPTDSYNFEKYLTNHWLIRFCRLVCYFIVISSLFFSVIFHIALIAYFYLS